MSTESEVSRKVISHIANKVPDLVVEPMVIKWNPVLDRRKINVLELRDEVINLKK